ncbi:AraC-type DNA-binding protein [Variovorax sp. HW608]|uniref:helix-turn-helix domain-containing protein n=1 Tax=Variovorax sp. HW608 TaxID=1034889 RepID=UPI00081F92D1|nr:helix-turn-helix domain-containing protein [Variovorax sp. HW608]SCK35325.1 AraC-type DNA-binding protein [Variovorax sp. HW608]
MTHSHFDTHGEATERQVLAWRDRVGHVVDVSPSKAQIANGFRGAIDRYAIGNLAFTDCRTDPLVLERWLARLSVGARQDYAFHVVTEGHTGHLTRVNRKRSAEEPSLGIVALDLNQAFRIERPASRLLSLFVPKQLIDSSFPNAESMHGRVIGRVSPLTDLVYEHMTALSRDLPTMNVHDAAEALQVGAQLLVATFQKQARVSGDTRAAMQSAVLGRVRRYIDRNLHQSRLSPSSVVNELKLTRSTVYRWFEHEGGLGAYILNRRLRAVVDELVRRPNEPIADIALGLGFKSASAFARAFRRAYGMSAQDARAQASELQYARRS